MIGAVDLLTTGTETCAECGKPADVLYAIHSGNVCAACIDKTVPCGVAA